jgi:predicted nucleic acid-binding protein
MSLLLYIETNFIIALAKGQDEEGEYLINNLPLNLTLALPSICYMEALFVLQAERQRRHSFRQSLQIEINEAHRNLRSQQAQLALQSLRESLLNYESLLNEFNNKFIDIFNLLEKEIEIIYLKKGTIQKTLSVAILREEKEFRDDFILQCIINDAIANLNEL